MRSLRWLELVEGEAVSFEVVEERGEGGFGVAAALKARDSGDGVYTRREALGEFRGGQDVVDEAE